MCTFKIVLMNPILSWEATYVLRVAHVGWHHSFRWKLDPCKCHRIEEENEIVCVSCRAVKN